MALSKLTNYVLSDSFIRLDYADGRQWYVPYGQIIATLIDPTSGQYIAKLFEKGLVGETLEATQADLAALGTNVQAFIDALNTILKSFSFWTSIYEDYMSRAATDGGSVDTRFNSRCAKSTFIEDMPTATDEYVLVWNTQTRSLADGGNGFDARSLDCSYEIAEEILN